MKVKAMCQLLYPSTGVKFAPWTTARRKAVYGWTEAQVRKQLVTIDFCGVKVAVHRKVAPQLKAVRDEIRKWERNHPGKEAVFTPRRIDSFNWRPIRGGTSLSRHAHAIALDIDPASNAYGSDTMNIPRHVVQVFINAGWRWGGNWNHFDGRVGSPCDPQHFEMH